jgi:hypothetical protein
MRLVLIDVCEICLSNKIWLFCNVSCYSGALLHNALHKYYFMLLKCCHYWMPSIQAFTEFVVISAIFLQKLIIWVLFCSKVLNTFLMCNAYDAHVTLRFISSFWILLIASTDYTDTLAVQCIYNEVHISVPQFVYNKSRSLCYHCYCSLFATHSMISHIWNLRTKILLTFYFTTLGWGAVAPPAPPGYADGLNVLWTSACLVGLVINYFNWFLVRFQSWSQLSLMNGECLINFYWLITRLSSELYHHWMSSWR